MMIPFLVLGSGENLNDNKVPINKRRIDIPPSQIKNPTCLNCKTLVTYQMSIETKMDAIIIKIYIAFFEPVPAITIIRIYESLLLKTYQNRII